MTLVFVKLPLVLRSGPFLGQRNNMNFLKLKMLITRI